MPILRFPHVLTTFAEADAMAGGPSAAAYDAVDAVRLRAGLPRLTRGLSREAFRDSVIAERGWEFAGEFTRWFDLVRTERVEATLAWKAPGDPTPQRAVTSMPKEHFYLMPIPQSEILLNPALTQNPGY